MKRTNWHTPIEQSNVVCRKIYYAFSKAFNLCAFPICYFDSSRKRIERAESINCKTNSSICFSLRVASYSFLPFISFQVPHIPSPSYIIFLISIVYLLLKTECSRGVLFKYVAVVSESHEKIEYFMMKWAQT